MKTFIASVLLALCFTNTAIADDLNCQQQDQALRVAEAVSAKDNATGKTIIRGLFQNGSSAMTSIHRSQLSTAQKALQDCFARVEREKQYQKDQAKVAAYNARPEVVAQHRAVDQANASTGGRVNIETFTPTEWLRGMGLTPWIPLGKTESKAFFYTFVARNFDAYINIKAATLGAGDDYTLMEFLSAPIDCRPGNGYPAALSMPTTYSYAASGRPLMDDFTSPMGVEIAIEHGTILAKAVIGACNAIRKGNGTVNYVAR